MENYPNPNSLAYAADPQGNAHLATDGTVQKVLNDIAKAVQTLLARSHEHDETQQAIVTAYKGWRRHMLVLFAKKPGARVVKGWGVWAGYCVSVELKKLLTELRTPTVLADPELAVNRLDLRNHINTAIVNAILDADGSLRNALHNNSPNIPEWFSIPEVHLVEHERHIMREPHIKQESAAEEEPHFKRESAEAVKFYAIPPHPSQLHSVGHHALLDRFSLRQQRLYRI